MARLVSIIRDGHMAMRVSNKGALWQIVSGHRRGGSYEDACSNKRPYGEELVSIIKDAGWQCELVIKWAIWHGLVCINGTTWGNIVRCNSQ